MKNNRRQAEFLLRSITDDVPQLLLEENNLVFRNELKEDILIPCSSIISIRFYLLIESIVPLLDF